MDKIRKTYFPFILFVLAITLAACDKMKDNYEPYIESGEIIYTPKALGFRAIPGYERLKLKWGATSNKGITEWVISYDDITVSVSNEDLAAKEKEYILTDVGEGSHEFSVYSKSTKGNKSIFTKLVAEIYGSKYAANLSPRGIKSITYRKGEGVALFHTSVPTGKLTEVKYVNSSNVEITKTIENSAEELVLEDLSIENPILIRTYYLPSLPVNGVATSLDEIVSEWSPFDKEIIIIKGTLDLTDDGVLTVSKDYSGGPNAGEGSLKVVDGSIDSKFLVFDIQDAIAAGFWMQQEFPQAVIVNKYTLTSANDAADRDPKDWTFSGSNDGETWVVVDTRSGESFSARKQTKSYHFESTTPYKFHRMTMTANNGGSLFQLAEWRLLESIPTDLTSDLSELKVSKDYSGGANAGEGSLKVVDGSIDSKFLVFDIQDAIASGFWMQQGFSQEVNVNHYTLTSANDAADRDPKDWTLSGSNDELTWVVVDTRSDESFSARKQTKKYYFESTTSYKFYRMTMTANNGGSLFQLSEWRLLEE